MKNKDIFKKLGKKVEESFLYKDDEMTNEKRYLIIDPIKHNLDSRVLFDDLHDIYGGDVDVHGYKIVLHDVSMLELKRHFPEYAQYATIWNPKQRPTNKTVSVKPEQRPMSENKKSIKTTLKEAEQKDVNFHKIDDMFRKIAKDIVATSEMLASKGVGEKNEFMKKLKTMYGIFTDMGSAEKAFGGYQTVSEDIVTDKAKAVQNPTEFKKTVDLAKKVDTNIQLNENINNMNMRVEYQFTMQPVKGDSRPLKGGETQLVNIINKYGNKDFTIGQINANQISLYTIDEEGNDYTLTIKGNFDEDEAREIANAFVQEEMIEEDSIYDYAPEEPEINSDEYGDEPVGKFNCKIFIPKLTNLNMIKQFESEIKNTERQGYTSFTVQGVNTQLENGGLFVELVGMCDLDTGNLRKTFEHDLADVVEGIVNRIPEMVDVDFY